jgi:hypothetical protein
VANTITEVVPKLLAQGLMALRENAIMPRLVNRSYENVAAQLGNVINVPIPSAIAARDVTAAVAMATNVDSAPTSAAVTLDFWKEGAFQMSDQDVVSVMSGTIPMQASEAVKSLGNAIDAYIMGKHTGIFGITGTAGTTPFATLITAASDARKLLNKQLAPMDNRRGVLDPDAEANFLTLSNILQVDQRGDQGGIVAGSIGTKLGLDWYMDQNVTTFTPGTALSTATSVWSFNAAVTAGSKTANIIASSSGTLKIGDVFYVATGVFGGYVITAATTMVTTTTLAVSFYPGARQDYAANATITLGGAVAATAYVVNLAFHRDAFAWASRPLADIDGFGSLMQSVADPTTGVALRLEVSRQYKQTTFSYDVMGGAQLVRRELAVKIKG